MPILAPPPSKTLMADPREFSRRFKELTAGESQTDVAVKLGYRQSRISQVSRGEKPSREFVERLIDAYDLPREEWLALAGFGPKADGEVDHRLEALIQRTADETARRLVQAEEPISAADVLLAGLRELQERYPHARVEVPRLHGGIRSLTPEGVQKILDSIERQIRDEGLA